MNRSALAQAGAFGSMRSPAEGYSNGYLYGGRLTSRRIEPSRDR